MLSYSMRIITQIVPVVVIILMLFGLINLTEAGTCWEKRMESGKCKRPITRNITKENCCASGANFGYTHSEMGDQELFFATALGDGTSCESCIETCANAKCSKSKRCVIRNGRPRCICSPVCKISSKYKKKIKIFKSTNNKISKNSSDKLVKYSIKNDNTITTTTANITTTSTITTSTTTIDKLNINNNNVDIINRTINSNNNNNNNLLLKSSDSENNRKNTVRTKINEISDNNKKDININNKNSNRNRHSNRKPSKRKYSNNTHQNIVSDTADDVNITNGHNYRLFAEERSRLGIYGQKLIDGQIDDFDYPVCGSDGKSYISECLLKRTACRKEITSLTVAYRGQCQTTCKGIMCPNGQHCIEDQNLKPHCVRCQTPCPNSKNSTRLVCGVDGINYISLCEIKREACLIGRTIPVAHNGACKAHNNNCSNIKCKRRQTCLTDLITHRPRCVSCSFKCPRRRSRNLQPKKITICGTNNSTYHSFCQMTKESCSTGFFIDMKHEGICRSSIHL